MCDSLSSEYSISEASLIRKYPNFIPKNLFCNSTSDTWKPSSKKYIYWLIKQQTTQIFFKIQGQNDSYSHWRPSGLKSGGALTKYVRAGQKKWSTYIYIISGRCRKSGGAIALVALVRWAPLHIHTNISFPEISTPDQMYRTKWKINSPKNV